MLTPHQEHLQCFALSVLSSPTRGEELNIYPFSTCVASVEIWFWCPDQKADWEARWGTILKTRIIQDRLGGVQQKNMCHSESLENKDFVRNFQAVQNLSRLEC